MSETTPTPKPTPRPIPRPRVVTPVAPQPTFDEAAAARAMEWGRVDGEGNVWLRSGDGERIVGQYAVDGTSEDALALYVRRYLDLASQISLLESRVGHISAEEARASLKVIEKELVEPAVVGDVQALRDRAAKLTETINARAQQEQEERAAAREKALAERTALIERAEEIAESDPHNVNWRDARNELMSIFDAWREAQKNGPRLERSTEEALWSRYSKARSHFDKKRKAFFATLDKERARIEEQKEALIKRAEEISDSTDWGPTSRALRSLMDEWKKLGHVARREDEKLWKRFRAAQQKFYDARSQYFNARDEEFEANLQAKLALVEEAEKLLPVHDLDAARSALHAIQDKWEEIGMVARADLSRTEGRLREIENAIREAENEQWKASDPTKKERSNGMAAQLEVLINQLDSEIAEAEKNGDEAKLKELRSAREARVAWLEQVKKDL